MAGTVTKDLDDLTPHQISKEIYQQGRPSKRFLQDIRANGVEKPITINESDEILDGVRRYRAAQEVDGIDSIECFVKSPDDVEKVILRLNDDRNETFRQKMEVATRYKEKAEEALQARMEMGKSLDDMDPDEDPAQEFAEGKNATARELAATRVGWSDETLRKAEQIWYRADEDAVTGDPDAEGNVPHQLVEAINLGDMSISAAYQEFQEWLRRQEGRARVQWSEFMDVTTFDQMFDLYESVFEANLTDVDPDDNWREQVATLREHLDSLENIDQVENSDFVFAWHLEKRGLIDFNHIDDGPESIADREPDKGELERLYWEEEYSLGELAMNYGVNVELIKAWMRDKGVSLRLDSVQESHARDKLSRRLDIPEQYDPGQMTSELDGDVESRTI